MGALSEYEVKNRQQKDEIAGMQEKIAGESAKRGVIIDKFAKDIRASESRMKELLNSEINGSNEINSRLNKELEDHMFTMGLNHTKVVKVAEDERDRQINEVNYLLADIRENIEAEAVEKEEGIYQITEQLKKEATVLNQHLALENKIREESVNKITTMTQEIFGQLRLQLRDEQVEREQNSEAILKVLEEMCNKLDRKLNQY